MRIFLTGATGFVGSRVAADLVAAGHDVIGMTRSETGVRTLSKAGIAPHQAALDDLDAIRAGAAPADAVIHTAFDHDFTRYVANCEQDRRVIGALAAELKGSNRPLVITSAVGIGEQGGGLPAVETVFNAGHPVPRIATEEAGIEALQAGVDVRVVRLPQVHDTVKQGLVTLFVELCRDKDAVGYVGEGGARWSAAPVIDVARLFRLALERGRAGERYHAVAEEGVPFRQIAEAVAEGLGKPAASIAPADADAWFGWFAMFADLEMFASSALTRERLGWQPDGPGLIEDLRRMDYTRR